MMITGTALAKALPEAFDIQDLKAMKTERKGKNWVSWCNKTFQGGYIAVHNRMVERDVPSNKRVVVSENYKKAATEFAQNKGESQLAVFKSVRVPPADRAAKVLANNLDALTYNSRKFLCQIIVKDMRSISPKQEKWLSDLEQKA